MRKIRKRINVDKKVWQRIRGLQFRGSRNLSQLIADLIEDYLNKEERVRTKPGPKATIDITIDKELWEKAKKFASAKDMSMSQLVRQLLREYLESAGRGGKQ